MTTTTVPKIMTDEGYGPDLTGLDGHLGYSLDPGGETYTVTMPPGWRPPGSMTRREFAGRITTDEWLSVHQSDDPAIRHWLYMLQIAEEVRLDDPDTVAAVEYAEQIGLLGPGRATEILTP